MRTKTGYRNVYILKKAFLGSVCSVIYDSWSYPEDPLIILELQKGEMVSRV